MTKIKLQQHTGDASEGNPYEGDRGIGIEYDAFECRFPVVEQEGSYPVVRTAYRSVANKLVRHLPEITGSMDSILDIGCGTGISTLELLAKTPRTCQVFGVDKSPEMLAVARYKFHKDSGEGLMAHVNDQDLLSYWEKFRDESQKYRSRIHFHEGNIENIQGGIVKGQSWQGIEDETQSHAIANQSLHWVDLPKAFGTLQRLLKPGGQTVWNTSSHFYDDERFPSAEWGFRYHNFMGFVLDEISKSSDVNVTGDYRELSSPPHNLESIKDITNKSGFETEQVALYLLPVDFQGFIQHDVPGLVKSLVEMDLHEDEFGGIISRAIAEAVRKPEALKDLKHKYDTNPIFRSVKKD